MCATCPLLQTLIVRSQRSLVHLSCDWTRCFEVTECCNTLGVCHQLSNGFELKHGMLSGDEGVKIKSTRVSSNLNLDNTPLLTMCTLVKIMQE